MTGSPYELLEFVVTASEECEGPLTPGDVAERRGADAEVVGEQFERFVDCELLVPVADGYRPTVTARELLELDVDPRVLIVDASEDA